MKRLNKNNAQRFNSVEAFKCSSCTCSCKSCSKWYTNAKSGTKDIGKVQNAANGK